jgi:4-hydroxymandelate oxidase
MPDTRFVTVEDYEVAAREVLDRATYDYYAGGAGDERTIRANRRAFDRWALRPRVLRGAAAPDTGISLFGDQLAIPVLIAPWAYPRMAHPDGEGAIRRAAARAGTVMVVSSTSHAVLDDAAAAADAPAWWQMYLAIDRAFSADMLGHVVAAGYRAIVWTVDLPIVGLRDRDVRNAFTMPVGPPGAAYEFDPAISWDDLAWIRDHAPGLPVLVKGVMRSDDAILAVEHGADAVIVSNHGGRQLDAAAGTLDVLPEVVDAVGGRVPVLVDGGIRRGTDVVIALALGADAVLVGRPVCWGLAVAGEDGVADVLRILRDETANVMAQCGCRDMAAIQRDLVAPAS